MERRYLGSNATSSHHSSTSHILRPTNSFIPTSASGHGHHGHGNALPHPNNPNSKIHVHQSTTNLQQQQQPQAPSQQQIPPPQSHNYYNGGSNHTGTLGHHVPPSVQHHHQQQQQQLIQHQQQQLQYHQRAMTKSYSTSHYNNGVGANNTLSSNNIHHHHHHHQSQQQQHFYGTTTSHHPNGNAINGHGQQQQQQQPPPPSQHSLPPPQSVHHSQQQQQPQPPPSQQYPIPQSHQTYITTTGNNNNNNGLITNPPYHHNNITHYQVAETEGLPQTLVESMRTLFDILDDTKQGKIRLSDIESRWEADPNGTNGKATGAEPLIKMGVMGYLRKVTPADGMLTFERFCAGLRLALLTNNDNNNNHNNSTTNNHSSLHNPPIHHQFQQQLQLHQQQQQQHPPPPPPPQQQLPNNFHHPQQQILVKASSVTSNSHNVSSNSGTHAILNNSSNGTNHTYSQSNSNTLPASAGGSKSMLSLQGNQIPASNTMHRTSKIPSLSTSRLPMPSNGSSGIPVSPNNRLNATYMSTTNSSPSTTTVSAIPPPNGTMTNGTSGVENHHGNHHHQQHRSGGTVKRGQPATPEQGTTVAIVHYQPKTPGIPSYSASSGTLKLNKQSSSALSSSAKYTAKNGSLDNLKSPLEEKLMVTGTKERPPSAPLLDNEPDPKPSSTLLVNHSTVKTTVNHHRTSNHTTTPTSHSHSSNATSRRERARSRDRDREERNKSSDDITNDDGSKRISYVSPRQRTLSMPQLQLSKLKPKSIVSIEDSSSPPSAGKANNADKGSLATTNALKSNKSLPLIAPSFVSAIPTIGMTSKIQQHHNHQQQQQSQKIDISPSASANSSNAGGTVERESHSTLIVTTATIKEKEQPPPPPKPPRNGLNGPIIITTNLVNNEIIVSDVPHSGGSSSTMSGSGLSTSNTSTGTNNNSSSNNNPSKPEIRSALQTWQKGLSEKKPLESTLSTASTVNSLSASSIISNSTSKSAAPPPSTGKNDSTSNNIPPTNENDVKLRANNNGKGNARRRETPRRHTVQSGIDFATLKRLKQLEQERDVLQQGITYLDKAKEWYKKQLEGAEEKIALLSKGAPASEYWSESHEERLNLLGCRVSEVNSLLTALMDGSSLPLHMNLQIPTHLSLRTITRLKEQNRQLTQEVSECGHRVTQLEAEKAMLLRQLFHQKNSNHSEETVYM